MLRLQDISSAAGGKNHVFMSPCSAAGGKNFVEIIEKRGGVSDFPKMRNEKSEKRNGEGGQKSWFFAGVFFLYTRVYAPLFFMHPCVYALTLLAKFYALSFYALSEIFKFYAFSFYALFKIFKFYALSFYALLKIFKFYALSFYA